MTWNWHIAGYGLATLALAGLAFAYEGAQRDKIRSDAVQQAQATYQKQLEAQIADRDKLIADRDAKYQQDKQDLQKQFQGNLQQIVALIGQRASLPVPLQIVTPPPTAANPNPQPQVIVPSEDLPQAKAYVQACEQCNLDRTKAQADLADRQAQQALAQKQIESLQTQRDAALVAAKGTTWQRTWKALKYIGIGAGAGAAVLCGSGHCKL